jgi:hypothetical protein
MEKSDKIKLSSPAFLGSKDPKNLRDERIPQFNSRF